MRAGKAVIQIAILLLAGGLHSGRTQNLLRNPGFEEYGKCPERLGNFETDILYWSVPTKGSTDYFHACSETMGTPENFNGQQPPQSGRGYAGLYLYAPDDYREYVQGELSRPLVKDRSYRISFYLSLAERSDFAVRDLELLFSSLPVRVPTLRELNRGQLYRDRNNTFSFVALPGEKYLDNTREWIRIETRFVASGQERYVTLGNFRNNAQTVTLHRQRNAKQGAYYYLDNLSLEASDPALTPGGEEATAPAPTGYALGERHVFETLLFHFDTHELTDSAKSELDRMYVFLKADPGLELSVSGHTDTIGSEAYNLNLSGLRSRAVTDYLRELGMPEDRLKWEAHGSLQPAADNATEEGRKRNRRVEFVFHKAGDL